MVGALGIQRVTDGTRPLLRYRSAREGHPAAFGNPKDDAPAEDLAGPLSSRPRELEIVDIVCSSVVISL